MKAVIFTETGNLESIKTVELPIPEPLDKEVQIEVKAAALSVSDFKAFEEKLKTGHVSALSKIIIPANKPFGGDIAGIVTKVGGKVDRFRVGDEVYASIGTNGACTEYVLVDESKVFQKPKNLSYEEASAIPTAGIVAMEACKKANIKNGMSVLVQGASGGVGNFAVEIAKAMGAEVTATCSTRNIENIYSIGADEVVDYKHEDITERDKCFDVILGVNGNITLSSYKKMLNKGGTYIAIGGKQAISGLIAPIYSFGSGKRMTFVVYASAVKHGHLETLKTLAEQSKIKPFIEHIYKPDEMKIAIETICKEHAKGKNVVTMQFE